MIDNESPPEKKRRSAVDDRAPNETINGGTDTAQRATTQAPQSRCVDQHLAAYFPFVARLYRRSGSGIGGFYLIVALTLYSLFCTTCDRRFRHQSWQAVQTALQFLCQPRHRN